MEHFRHGDTSTWIAKIVSVYLSTSTTADTLLVTRAWNPTLDGWPLERAHERLVLFRNREHYQPQIRLSTFRP